MITETQIVQFDSIELDCGSTLAPVDIAYETYGELNARKNNAILVLHAFTGDAHAAGTDKTTGAAGWWDSMIGPGKGFDTDKYFVICSNILGGCRGTSGPGSINPETGCPYAMSFPPVTIPDMVRLQKMLVDHLGIERLLAVSGGSMGAMQALQWAVAYPEAVAASIPIAGTARHSQQQIAFNEVGRQAIMADLDWNEGDYYGKHPPARGLAVARMVGHITYMSDASMREKFGRRLRDQDQFEVESYLRYRGNQFVDRFDANSYLYITRAMDYFDLAAERDGSLPAAFAETPTRFCVISFTSDWLFPTSESRELVQALNAVAANVSFVEVETENGHDAFLLHEPELFETLRGFLAGCAEHRGLPRSR
jgi:homoserine O-acetyltransferase/O-succinyltransferase